jgi:branched-chain amino acid transport system substrate-binding protein
MRDFMTFFALAFFLGAVQAQILIGQTAGYSGIVSASVREIADGATLYIDAINARGGVHGQKIEVISLDDKFDPKLAAENARILIEEKNVVALFLGRGTPHTEAIVPIVEKAGVPYVAPSTGAMSLHEPVKKYIFNVRAPYQVETRLAVKYLSTLGLTRIGVVHVDDSFGKDGLTGALKGFDEVKAKALFVEKYDRIKPDFNTIVPRAVKDDAQAIIFVGAQDAVSNGVKALRAAGSKAQVVTLSNNAAGSFINALGENARGVVVMQVFPGERNAGHPFVSEALTLAAVKGVQGVKELTPLMLEGFAAAKVLVEALNRTGPNPTREKLQRTLENFKSYDLGGKLVVEFSRTDHTGLRYADLSIIGHDGKFKR